MLCREWTLLKQQGQHISAEPLRCKCWTCAECAPRRKDLLRRLGRAGNPDTFITLTVRPQAYETPGERAQALVRALRVVWRQAKRRYGYDKIPFLAVFEKTKRGEPHLHILARSKWIDQRWLSELMGSLIGAPIVDIRRVKSQAQMVNYVTKYIGKDPTVFDGCKRYWCSRDWRLVDENELKGDGSPIVTYEIFRGSMADAAVMLRTRHYLVEWREDMLAGVKYSHILRGPPP